MKFVAVFMVVLYSYIPVVCYADNNDTDIDLSFQYFIEGRILYIFWPPVGAAVFCCLCGVCGWCCCCCMWRRRKYKREAKIYTTKIEEIFNKENENLEMVSVSPSTGASKVENDKSVENKHSTATTQESSSKVKEVKVEVSEAKEEIVKKAHVETNVEKKTTVTEDSGVKKEASNEAVVAPNANSPSESVEVNTGQVLVKSEATTTSASIANKDKEVQPKDGDEKGGSKLNEGNENKGSQNEESRKEEDRKEGNPNEGSLKDKQEMKEEVQENKQAPLSLSINQQPSSSIIDTMTSTALDLTDLNLALESLNLDAQISALAADDVSFQPPKVDIPPVNNVAATPDDVNDLLKDLLDYDKDDIPVVIEL